MVLTCTDPACTLLNGGDGRKHDTSLFKPGERKSLTIDRESSFPFAYRAIAYERFAKEVQVRMLEVQRRMDQGHFYWKQVLIQQQMNIWQAGIEIGMRDVDGSKAQFDELLVLGGRGDFHFVAVQPRPLRLADHLEQRPTNSDEQRSAFGGRRRGLGCPLWVFVLATER